MRIIDGFKLRTVMGQSVIIGEGTKQVNFSKIISLNASSAMLWRNVEGKDFTNDDLAKLLVEHYGIDTATALEDATAISKEWMNHGLVED